MKEHVRFRVTTVKVIRTAGELTEYSGRWNELLRESTCHNVFMTWEWISNWVDVYLAGDELLVIVVSQDDELVAIAPLWVDKTTFSLSLPLKVLKFLGSGEVCGDHLDIITRSAEASMWSDVVWEHLFGPLSREWDVFEYFDVRDDSPVLDTFRRRSRNDNRCLRVEPVGHTVCPYLRLPESWDDFMESCSGSRRYTINYSRRRLAEQGELELVFCQSPDELSDQMRGFITLHQKSWVDRGKPGSFSEDRFERFHMAVARDFLDVEVLFLCSLRLDGEHIGSFYGFDFNKTLYYYLLGVKRNPVKRVKTGTALLGFCIEEAIKRGCGEFDFLRGDEEYKYRWTADDRRNPRFTFFQRKPIPLAYLSHCSTIRFAKNVLRAILGRRVAYLKRFLRR